MCFEIFLYLIYVKLNFFNLMDGKNYCFKSRFTKKNLHINLIFLACEFDIYESYFGSWLLHLNSIDLLFVLNFMFIYWYWNCILHVY